MVRQQVAQAAAENKAHLEIRKIRSPRGSGFFYFRQLFFFHENSLQESVHFPEFELLHKGHA